ncbi:MAG: hypothetical protein JST01_21055 [Cyanobacteria bacterium SZAS TMP-1]|nr:hypothetical protein [Cyanobacteria bacterium SZAS TMP-1]
MHHHHFESAHHNHQPSQIDQDERAVTKWLNTMEASLANPKSKFDIAKFSDSEIDAINKYMHSHEKSLARYDQFLPKVHIVDHSAAASAADTSHESKHKPAEGLQSCQTQKPNWI